VKGANKYPQLNPLFIYVDTAKYPSIILYGRICWWKYVKALMASKNKNRYFFPGLYLTPN